MAHILKKSQVLLVLTTLISGAFMSAFIIFGCLVLLLDSELPDDETIQNIELKIPLRVYTSEGLLISEFGDERRNPLEINDFPQQLINSILAAEDDAFFEHNGIDLKGLIRAAIRNFTSSGSRKEGASTVTMQVARNFFLTRDQTYTRKITEIIVAIKLEQILSKNEILSLYLNKIFLGHRAYGFGAAADVYYGKPLNELSLAELAMLAGLPKAPSTLNPISNPKNSIARRNYVLGRLYELEYISKDDYELALEQPVTAQRHSQPSEISAPHIAEMVRAKLIELFGPDVYWQGLSVTTTIRATEQIAAEKALRKGLQAYDRRHGFRGAIAQIDLNELEIDPESPQSYENLLKTYPSSQEQIPALVIETSEQEAKALTQESGSVILKLENAKWAKRHRTQNIVGERPSSMEKLLSVGDIVYIKAIAQAKEVASETPPESEPEQEWALSQIPNVSGALISTNPNTGEIISLVGGYDFFLNKYNRAVQSIRQPGSNIKPFIYSASLDKGFSPASLISGAPIVIRDQTHGTVWRPENYSGKFFGPTRMRTALAKSMNLVSIRLLRSIGIPYTREYVERFGVDMNRFSSSLTMALGAGGATPLEILSAYGVLANGGYRVNPYYIEKITDRNGQIIFQAPTAQKCDECYQDYLPEPLIPDEIATEVAEQSNPVNSTDVQSTPLEETIELEEESETYPSHYAAPRVMSHANNYLTVSMLKDVITRGTARKALALNRKDLAGKTGTTNDYVDAWFSGFNSQVATTVWVGFDNPSSMGRGEAGGVAALPIWIDYMQTALNAIPEDSADIPTYIEQGFINKTTGQRTTEQDPQAVPEYFVISELTPENLLFGDVIVSDEETTEDGELVLQDPELEDSITENNLEEELENIGDQFGLDELGIEQTQETSNNAPRIIEDTQDTEGLF